MKPPMRFKSICVVVGAFLLLSSVSYAGPLPVVFLDRVVAIGRKEHDARTELRKVDWRGVRISLWRIRPQGGEPEFVRYIPRHKSSRH